MEGVASLPKRLVGSSATRRPMTALEPVLSENHIRIYWWCSPDQIGMVTMTPDRWTARPRGASFAQGQVRAHLIVVHRIGSKNLSQVRLAKDQHLCNNNVKPQVGSSTRMARRTGSGTSRTERSSPMVPLESL